MKTPRTPLPALALAITALWPLTTPAASKPDSAGAGPIPGSTVLAIVNGDTVTVGDLDVELLLADRAKDKDTADAPLPQPGDVLQRLVQNELLVQEGRRMGEEQAAMITNQVNDNVRQKAIVAMLDSVAFSVTADSASLKKVRLAAIDDFIDGLMKKYNVVVDSTLLRSLDYGSADSLVQKRLREDDAILARAPTGALRVSGLTRELMFKEFHGLQGRPDADKARDDAFRQWLTEAVLTYESRRLGWEKKPEIRKLARYQERDLTREQAVNMLGTIRFDPDEKEVEDFYRKNIDHLTPPARVKVRSALLENEDAARLFKKRLEQGAELNWLAERTAAVRKDVQAIPTTWLQPGMIGLKPGEAKVGEILDPMEVPGGWVVVQIAEIEKTEPVPLADCRDEVLRRLKAEKISAAVKDGIERLQDSADISLAPDAKQIIAKHLAEWKKEHDG